MTQTQVIEHANATQTQSPAAFVRWYVWSRDSHDDDDPQYTEPFYDIYLAGKYAAEKANQGFKTNIEAETPEGFVLSQVDRESFQENTSAERKLIIEKMAEIGFPLNRIRESDKMATEYGMHYGRAIAFASKDPWQDWDGIDPRTEQFLKTTKGCDEYTIKLVDLWAEFFFWLARDWTISHNLSAQWRKVAQ